MKGLIKTYIPEKGYGFIKGDDGKDYYVHKSDFLHAREGEALCENVVVEFEQAATPKGYRARRCVLATAPAEGMHVVPDEFLISKNDGVKGWDVVEHGTWIVHGSSRNSPDAARQQAISNARSVGANGMTHFEYYKTTGSEAGTGRGTHYFTIHNFRGKVVVLAKRSANGRFTRAQLSGMNEKAGRLKTALAQRSAASRSRRNSVWLAVVIASLVAVFTFPLLIFALVAAGIIFGRATDHDSWLQRA